MKEFNLLDIIFNCPLALYPRETNYYNVVKLRSIGSLTFAKVNQVLELLKNSYPDLQTLSSIGNELEMNHNTIKYFLERYLKDFVTIEQIGNIRLCLVRLKEDKKESTIQDVIRFYKVRKAIQSQSLVVDSQSLAWTESVLRI
jgi:hypothetical protein